jgi:CheY-like chemotaxis protein
VFTLYLPQTYVPSRQARPRASPQPATPPAPEIQPLAAEEPAELQFANEAGDDRDDIQAGDLVILIVENDLGFAKILLEAAREEGFKGVAASSGAAALAMVREYQPAVMTLDIFLPDMQGWRVLERLKADLSTRHIPVCVVSTDEALDRALDSGAIGFISKPLVSKDLVDRAIERLKSFVSRPSKQVLLLMPDGEVRAQIVERLGAANVPMLVAWSGDEALRLLRTSQVDCLVIGEGAGDLEAQDVLDVLAEQPVAQMLPVVFHGENALAARWKTSERVFALREAHTRERLLDYIYFFLHRSAASMPAGEREFLENLHSTHRILEGKRALIVDDDMRNIFALATVLDEQGMEIVSANNGRDAIRKVETGAEIDVVLMDIMMPEMDGITTIKEIRKLPQGGDLPIIAVTAKAMKGDREKCIEAGAWDYLSKPVDRLHLLAVLRGWLHR